MSVPHGDTDITAWLFPFWNSVRVWQTASHQQQPRLLFTLAGSLCAERCRFLRSLALCFMVWINGLLALAENAEFLFSESLFHSDIVIFTTHLHSLTLARNKPKNMNVPKPWRRTGLEASALALVVKRQMWSGGNCSSCRHVSLIRVVAGILVGRCGIRFPCGLLPFHILVCPSEASLCYLSCILWIHPRSQ